MKKLNLFLMLVMLGFGIMTAQTAQAASTVTGAPCESSLMLATNDDGNCGIGPNWNNRIAIAPYAQVVADDTYTFIGISHPSLATAHTSIGVVVEAMNMTTVPNTEAGRAAVFTVSAGETHRVFVVNQSHATINVSNSSFTDTLTHIITTSDASQFGNIKVWGVGTHPAFGTGTGSRPGAYTSGSVQRFDNISQLSMWGVVYKTSNGAGFALEFVGDMHDSSVSGGTKNAPLFDATGVESVAKNTSGTGRGIN